MDSSRNMALDDEHRWSGTRAILIFEGCRGQRVKKRLLASSVLIIGRAVLVLTALYPGGSRRRPYRTGGRRCSWISAICSAKSSIPPLRVGRPKSGIRGPQPSARSTRMCDG